MDVLDKLTILTDSAKYDVACTSSGNDRAGNKSGLGSTVACGICHTFSADGRCVSLLKVLLTNFCIYDCKYCVNRVSNDVRRAAFTPVELADLTIQFYRRNYIEGLFLSSAVIQSPDYTMEQMIKALEILRNDYHFRGYIHAKTIPGASEALVTQLGLLADRLSVNIELPSEASLRVLAPDKTRSSILLPMANVSQKAKENKAELALYRSAPKFVPAGQSTQMIVGASPESDFQILRLTEGLYHKYSLKRVFFSAYIPVSDNKLLPALGTKPPLLREHRLYQADWLLRFYNFSASEILSEQTPDFDPYLDPKCNWALHNMHCFPIDINSADYNTLLRVPGIGPKSAQRIIKARSCGSLDFQDLKRIGVVLKRAQYFIVCRGFTKGIYAGREETARALLDPSAFSFETEQTSLFTAPLLQQLMGQNHAPQFAVAAAKNEVSRCIAARM
ncbi:MAG: putative DNA modification/repair radical SAM protein [Oscillospiraceae bacterium]